MRIAIGADHAGFPLKQHLVATPYDGRDPRQPQRVVTDLVPQREDEVRDGAHGTVTR